MSSETHGPTRREIVDSDADDIGHRVVEYDEVRCPECDRMLKCIRWEDYGWPEVHCEACGIRESWPFDEIENGEFLEAVYDALDRDALTSHNYDGPVPR